jgi:hypothetical protein
MFVLGPFTSRVVQVRPKSFRFQSNSIGNETEPVMLEVRPSLYTVTTITVSEPPAPFLSSACEMREQYYIRSRHSCPSSTMSRSPC